MQKRATSSPDHNYSPSEHTAEHLQCPSCPPNADSAVNMPAMRHMAEPFRSSTRRSIPDWPLVRTTMRRDSPTSLRNTSKSWRFSLMPIQLWTHALPPPVTRAQMRTGILATQARTTWGLEISVLRITHDAIITSLLRYGLEAVGSRCPDDIANRIDAAIINTAARRISGLLLSTRIEGLRFLAGTHSYCNFFILHCAAFLHQGLLNQNSMAQQRLVADMQTNFHVCQLTLAVESAEFDIAEMFLTESYGVPIALLRQTKWMGNR